MAPQRLFLAIPLPETFRAALQAPLQHFRQSLGALPLGRTRWTPEPNWHVTAFLFGNVAGERIAQLAELLQPIIGTTPRFILQPRCLTLAPPEKRNPTMVWLQFEENPVLTALSHRVYEVTRADFGFEPPREVVVPHVTLARFQAFGGSYPPLAFEPEPLPVPQIELWNSLRLSSGAAYASLTHFVLSPSLSH